MLGIAPGSPSGKSAIQNQVTDPLRVSDGIDDRDRTSLRNSEQRKAIQLGGFDHAFEILFKSFERYIVDVPIGESVAAFVVADKLMMRCESVQQTAPNRALPIIFEVIEPVGRFDQ